MIRRNVNGTHQSASSPQPGTPPSMIRRNVNGTHQSASSPQPGTPPQMIRRRNANGTHRSASRPRYGGREPPGFGSPESCRSGVSASFASPASHVGGGHNLDAYGPGSAKVVMPSVLPGHIRSIHPSSTLLFVVSNLQESVKAELDTPLDFTLDGSNTSEICGWGFKLLEGLLFLLASSDSTVDHSSIASMGEWAFAQGLWSSETYDAFMELKSVRKKHFHFGANDSLQAVKLSEICDPDKIWEYFEKYKQVVKSLDLFDRITIKSRYRVAGPQYRETLKEAEGEEDSKPAALPFGGDLVDPASAAVVAAGGHTGGGMTLAQPHDDLVDTDEEEEAAVKPKAAAAKSKKKAAATGGSKNNKKLAGKRKTAPGNTEVVEESTLVPRKSGKSTTTRKSNGKRRRS